MERHDAVEFSHNEQALHEGAPGVLNVPDRQAEQVDEPDDALKVPAGQKLHVGEPIMEYVPALQPTQVDACAGEYEPAAHGVQDEAPTIE